MRYLKQIVAGIAAVSVAVFWASLFTVALSNGMNGQAAEICTYSMVVSFISLVLYNPKKESGHLVS